jgi:hypothetical protein
MTHWPFCTTYSAGAYDPSGHCSAIAGSPRSPQLGPVPEEEETEPELDPELDEAPELEPELEPELLPLEVVGSIWPEQATEKIPLTMARAAGKQTNWGRSMGRLSSMRRAGWGWGALIEIIGIGGVPE